jgi:hypothetical protein
LFWSIKKPAKADFFKRSFVIQLSNPVKRSTVSGSFATACSAEAGKAKTQQDQGAWLWYCAGDLKGHAICAA